MPGPRAPTPPPKRAGRETSSSVPPPKRANLGTPSSPGLPPHVKVVGGVRYVQDIWDNYAWKAVPGPVPALPPLSLPAVAAEDPPTLPSEEGNLSAPAGEAGPEAAATPAPHARTTEAEEVQVAEAGAEVAAEVADEEAGTVEGAEPEPELGSRALPEPEPEARDADLTEEMYYDAHEEPEGERGAASTPSEAIEMETAEGRLGEEGDLSTQPPPPARSATRAVQLVLAGMEGGDSRASLASQQPTTWVVYFWSAALAVLRLINLGTYSTVVGCTPDSDPDLEHVYSSVLREPNVGEGQNLFPSDVVLGLLALESEALSRGGRCPIPPPAVKSLASLRIAVVGDSGLALYSGKGKWTSCAQALGQTLGGGGEPPLFRVLTGAKADRLVREGLATLPREGVDVVVLLWQLNDLFRGRVPLPSVPADLAEKAGRLADVLATFPRAVAVLGAEAKLWGATRTYDEACRIVRGVFHDRGILWFAGDMLFSQTTGFDERHVADTPENHQVMAMFLAQCVRAANLTCFTQAQRNAFVARCVAHGGVYGASRPEAPRQATPLVPPASVEPATSVEVAPPVGGRRGTSSARKRCPP